MKKILIGLAIVFVLAAIAVFVIKQSQPSPDQVFRKYLENSVSDTHLESEDSADATGATGSAKGSLDTEEKKLVVAYELSCTTKVQNKEVKMSASLQLENAVIYVRLNDITGQAVGQTGTILDLSTVYSKAKGGWYKVVSEDPAIKSQLDNGVYVFSSALLAPSYDKQKVVDALINKKAFEYTSSRKEGDNFVFELTTNKDAYLKVLKEQFPSLGSPDLILEDIFYDGPTIRSTLTVSKDGELIREDLAFENACNQVVSTFIGDEADDLSKEMAGSSSPKTDGTIQIPPITVSKPIEEFQNDLVL